jgi:hypothetical protein
MESKYYVIAGDYNQFQTFIRRKATEMAIAGHTFITLSHFVYVSGPESLRGVKNPRGFFFGTWRDRPDMREIFPVLLHQIDDESTSRKIMLRLMDEIINRHMAMVSASNKIANLNPVVYDWNG